MKGCSVGQKRLSKNRKIEVALSMPLHAQRQNAPMEKISFARKAYEWKGI